MKTKISVYVLLCIIALTSSAWCKRGGTPIVEPVIYENKKYIAPNSSGIREYVVAWDIKNNRVAWEQTIFTNSIQPGLEIDVQWVFIKRLRIAEGNLLVTDERDREFLLDLKSKQVKRLK